MNKKKIFLICFSVIAGFALYWYLNRVPNYCDQLTKEKMTKFFPNPDSRIITKGDVTYVCPQK